MQTRVHFGENYCNLSININGELIKMKFKKELDNTILDLIQDSDNLTSEDRIGVISVIKDALLDFETRSLKNKYKKSE